MPDQIVNAHILFNCPDPACRPAAGRPGLPRLARGSSRWARSPSRPRRSTWPSFSALDESALDTPSQALANATREVVRVCETVEIMLKRIIELYESADADKIKALAALDDRVDRKHAAIKLYLAKVTKHPLTEDEALRCQELIGACVKLEQVGDIIVRNMLVHVQEEVRARAGIHRPKAGASLPPSTPRCWPMRGSPSTCWSRAIRETARQLVQEKDRLRDREKETSQSHFVRLRDGTAKSVETSSIHLDTIRDLKQINSLLASMAYPVLEERGLLTRLAARRLTTFVATGERLGAIDRICNHHRRYGSNSHFRTSVSSAVSRPSPAGGPGNEI